MPLTWPALFGITTVVVVVGYLAVVGVLAAAVQWGLVAA